ncbi:MAG: exodeoxyribonuclease VII small subunit [Alphaproteobacteria bacterium]
MASPPKTDSTLAKMSFEDALAELEKIVRELEEGKGKLEDAIGAYERGALLKRHCEAKLREAQSKIDKIVLAADGTISAEPVKID